MVLGGRDVRGGVGRERCEGWCWEGDVRGSVGRERCEGVVLEGEM